jgi:hypothetical protein
VISVCNFFCENGTRACTWGEDELAGESVTGGAAVRAKKYLNFYMQMSVANFGIKMNFYVYVCGGTARAVKRGRILINIQIISHAI